MASLRPILLVEDNPKDVELTLAALAKCQLANDVDVTRDGVEALDYLCCRGPYTGRNSGEPAVVLLDLKLPRLDGLEVLERIKRDPALQQVPVVMLTSSREEQDLVRSYRLGVNAFVVKPVGFREFFEAIKDLGMFWAILNEPPPLIGRGGMVEDTETV
ncbi:MAG: response regulator [Rhodospirillales bacterium]